MIRYLLILLSLSYHASRINVHDYWRLLGNSRHYCDSIAHVEHWQLDSTYYHNGGAYAQYKQNDVFGIGIKGSLQVVGIGDTVRWLTWTADSDLAPKRKLQIVKKLIHAFNFEVGGRPQITRSAFNRYRIDAEWKLKPQYLLVTSGSGLSVPLLLRVTASSSDLAGVMSAVLLVARQWSLEGMSDSAINEKFKQMAKPFEEK